MGPKSRWCRVSLVLVVVVGGIAAAFAGDAEWVEVRSPNFSVVTDAGERRGRDAALRFEQMRAVFGTLMVKAKVNTPVPLQIIAFRNHKEMRQVSPMWKGKPTDMAGLFQGGQDRCFIMLDMSVENPWQVVFHEYAHQLMDGNLDVRPDPWFNEGFAEYFSSIEVDGKDANIGKIPETEYQVLEQAGWMKIEDLLRVQQDSKTYNENGDHRTVFYSESGMLLHYLYDNGLVPKVGTYLNLEHERHVPVEEALQQAFGMTPAQLEKALRIYESSGHFKYYKLPAPAGIDSKTYTAARVGPADVQAILADVHLHSLDYREQAAAEFEAVLKLDPNNAAALRGLGYSYLMKQDYQHAGEFFHKAAERNPNDSRVLYYSAMLAQREGVSQDDPERLSSMQKELEASTRLDPEFADAYSLLAFTYMQAGKMDLALQTSIKAVQLNPGNEQYRFNLAEVCLTAQKLDAAKSLLESLQNSSDPGTAEHATNELRRLQEYQEARQHPDNGNELSQRGGTDVPRAASEPEPQPAAVAPRQPAKFLKGKLVSVDCSAAPAAVLSVLVGSKTWKLHTKNTAHTIVIGADEFSCAWTNQKIAVNYRETGDGEGDVISLEVQ